MEKCAFCSQNDSSENASDNSTITLDTDTLVEEVFIHLFLKNLFSGLLFSVKLKNEPNFQSQSPIVQDVETAEDTMTEALVYLYLSFLKNI